jgi:hypothetical protein
VSSTAATAGSSSGTAVEALLMQRVVLVLGSGAAHVLTSKGSSFPPFLGSKELEAAFRCTDELYHQTHCQPR